MTAKQSVINLAKRKPPRSSIEKNIKAALHRRQHLDTGISWVRTHISNRGNEIADREAAFHSVLGTIAEGPHVATQGDITVGRHPRTPEKQLALFQGTERASAPTGLSKPYQPTLGYKPTGPPSGADSTTLARPNLPPATADTTHRMAITSPSTTPDICERESN